MNRLFRYAAIGSLALIIGGASMQARASAASAPGDAWKSDELSAKKDGRGGGGKRAGKPGGGKHGGGAGRHHAVGRHDGGRHHGGRHGKNVVVINRNVRVVARPVRVWAPRPYYGRVVGGVALGTIIAAGVIGRLLRLRRRICAGTGSIPARPAAIGIIAWCRNRPCGRATDKARDRAIVGPAAAETATGGELPVQNGRFPLPAPHPFL